MIRGSNKGRRQECRLCKKRFWNLAAHEIVHYRDKAGNGYRIECPNCYRSFETIEEMKRHNSTTHSMKTKFSYQACFICSDQHVATHFKAISDAILDNLEEVHKRVGASLMSNQCPLCFYGINENGSQSQSAESAHKSLPIPLGSVMSTRKSFRHHLIFQHVLRDKFSLGLLLGSKVVHAEEEHSLVRMLLNSPGLLWKREAAKTARKNAENLTKILDAEESGVRVTHAKLKQELSIVEPPETSHDCSVRSDVRAAICDTANPTAANKVCINPRSQNSAPTKRTESRFSHPWEEMRSQLLSKCLDSTSPSSSSRVWRCRVCRDSFDNQISFEIHVGVKHLALRLNGDGGHSKKIQG